MNVVLMPVVILCSVGKDLVPEQTRQREEDKQEEDAAVPAGLHHHGHPTRRRRPWERCYSG